MLMRLLVIKHSAYKMKIVEFNWNKCICTSIWFHARIQHKHWIKLRKFIFNLIIHNIHLEYNKIPLYFRTKRKFHRIHVLNNEFIQMDCLESYRQIQIRMHHFIILISFTECIYAQKFWDTSSKLFRNCFLYCCMLLDFRFRLTHILNIMDQFIFAHHLINKNFSNIYLDVLTSVEQAYQIVNWLFTTYFQMVSEGEKQVDPHINILSNIQIPSGLSDFLI